MSVMSEMNNITHQITTLHIKLELLPYLHISILSWPATPRGTQYPVKHTLQRTLFFALNCGLLLILYLTTYGNACSSRPEQCHLEMPTRYPHANSLTRNGQGARACVPLDPGARLSLLGGGRCCETR